MEFPLVAFEPKGGVSSCPNLKEFTLADLRAVDDCLQIGIEVVDSGGAAWRIRGVDIVGRKGFFFAQFTIIHDLEPLPPVSLQAVQERVCTSLDADPRSYFGDELIYLDPEDRSTLAEPEEYAKLMITRIRAARSIAGVCQLLGDTWPF
jgi:hypothetical protein